MELGRKTGSSSISARTEARDRIVSAWLLCLLISLLASRAQAEQQQQPSTPNQQQQQQLQLLPSEMEKIPHLVLEGAELGNQLEPELLSLAERPEELAEAAEAGKLGQLLAQELEAQPYQMLPEASTVKRAVLRWAQQQQQHLHRHPNPYARQFDFGLGKRQPELGLSGPSLRSVLRMGDSLALESSPVQPVSQFGKRPSSHRFDFGLGKRLASPAYPRYDFGLGKRIPGNRIRYDFGLGK